MGGGVEKELLNVSSALFFCQDLHLCILRVVFNPSFICFVIIFLKLCVSLLYLANSLLCVSLLYLANSLLCVSLLYLANSLVCVSLLYLANSLLCVSLLYLANSLFVYFQFSTALNSSTCTCTYTWVHCIWEVGCL